ncbi:fluoride efflux transporter CrcB [Metabacillus sp. RGM 3146]|uniref:fluoride efflux transporter CrcB n=1 Tax=Metabacillus sp. RGM 3146 TaxID=3401092 RepID=UPI003B9C98AF
MVYLIVGAAGIAGALLRYYLGMSVSVWWDQSFPLSTLVINLIGPFILGWITTYLGKLPQFHPALVTGIGTGLIGSFTTFSAFSVETVKLIQASEWGTAILYVLLSLWGGLAMAWAGDEFGKSRLKQTGGSRG